jgi:hypothetical protein
MADDQLAGHDDAFYAPLFEPITAKLHATGGMDLEIFIGELIRSSLPVSMETTCI